MKPYFNFEYNSERRWMSYWYQIKEITNLKPKKILEIGVGNGLVSWFLGQNGMEVVTCDINKKLNPDVIADVRKLPFKKDEFDLILCSQVLEHIPFKYFKKALINLYKATNKWILLTLPDYSIFDFFVSFKLIPFLPRITKLIRIRYPIKHIFNGEHYWEINKKNFSAKKIRSIFKEVNFQIVKDYNPDENPFHRFFLLKKINYEKK